MAAEPALAFTAEGILSGASFPHSIVFHDSSLVSLMTDLLDFVPDFPGNNRFMVILCIIHFFPHVP